MSVTLPSAEQALPPFTKYQRWCSRGTRYLGRAKISS